METASTLMEMLMFSCEQIRGFLFNYLEGNLPLMTTLRFRVHIRRCLVCKRYFQLYKQTASASDFLDRNPLPDDVRSATLEFLEKEGVIQKE